MGGVNIDKISKYQDVNPANSSRKKQLSSILSRGWVQSLFSLLVGLYLPVFLFYQINVIGPRFFTSIQPTIVSSAIAIVGGLIVFRKMASLPGSLAQTKVVPAFLLTYGVIAIIAFGCRIELSRNLFLLSFTCVVVFQILFQYLLSYTQLPKIGVISGGKADDLLNITKFNWITIETVAEAKKYSDLPLVVDFSSSSISTDWEYFLADEIVSGRKVFSAKKLLESVTGKVQIDMITENSMGHFELDIIYSPIKKIIDFFVAFLTLCILGPLVFIPLSIAIRLDSRGPAIFKQKRIGYRGRSFTVYKFRSMHVNLEGDEGSLNTDITLSDDPRITRVGKFIRKTRMDELPQLYNVLRGEMSLIGPRPETIQLSNWYADEISFYGYRHIVKPGITGWAQVNLGHVTSIEEVREKMEYDFYYIKHFSVWLDLTIILQTIKVMITGSGSK